MASPAASNWPGSPSMPRPSPARPGQSPGNHPIMHSPQADHKTGEYFFLLFTLIFIKGMEFLRRRSDFVIWLYQECVLYKFSLPTV